MYFEQLCIGSDKLMSLEVNNLIDEFKCKGSIILSIFCLLYFFESVSFAK